jgi:hypothetical protein
MNMLRELTAPTTDAPRAVTKFTSPTMLPWCVNGAHKGLMIFTTDWLSATAIEARATLKMKRGSIFFA